MQHPRAVRDGRKLATEVLVGTQAVRNQIRERKSNLLRSTIQTGKADGMQVMDKSLLDLYQQGVITYETAAAHAHSPDYIKEAAGTDARRGAARV